MSTTNSNSTIFSQIAGATYTNASYTVEYGSGVSQALVNTSEPYITDGVPNIASNSNAVPSDTPHIIRSKFFRRNTSSQYVIGNINPDSYVPSLTTSSYTKGFTTSSSYQMSVYGQTKNWANTSNILQTDSQYATSDWYTGGDNSYMLCAGFTPTSTFNYLPSNITVAVTLSAATTGTTPYGVKDNYAALGTVVSSGINLASGSYISSTGSTFTYTFPGSSYTLSDINNGNLRFYYQVAAPTYSLSNVSASSNLTSAHTYTGPEPYWYSETVSFVVRWTGGSPVPASVPIRIHSLARVYLTVVPLIPNGYLNADNGISTPQSVLMDGIVTSLTNENESTFDIPLTNGIGYKNIVLTSSASVTGNAVGTSIMHNASGFAVYPDTTQVKVDSILIKGVPFNLGSTTTGGSTPFRFVGEQNLFLRRNTPYRGKRSSDKLLLMGQQVNQTAFANIQISKYSDFILTTSEENYYSQSQITSLMHIMEQLRFADWVASRDISIGWWI